jgi:drug/metabolite transporter (DMT)-like permease
MPGLDDLAAAGFGFTVGGLVLMPLAAAVAGIGFQPGTEAIGLLAALGTGPTAVAYTLYFRGLRTAAASTGALPLISLSRTGSSSSPAGRNAISSLMPWWPASSRW